MSTYHLKLKEFSLDEIPFSDGAETKKQKVPDVVSLVTEKINGTAIS